MGRPAVVAVSVIASTLGFGLAAQQVPPTFRAATEAVVLDVSVLDRNRHPVGGLTAADFTILEDGQAQAIRTFKEIDTGGSARPPEPVWSKEHPSDVRRNDEVRDHRVVVIVLDASTPMAGEDAIRTRQVGEMVIDQLEPGDLAAVVHTMNKPAGQDFTQDRALLRASVKRFSGSIAGEGELVYTLYRVTLSALSGVAKNLAALPEQRKALIFISVGLPLDPSRIAPQGLGSNEAGGQNQDMYRDLFEIVEAAQRSNISIYGIDPGGLRIVPSPVRHRFLRTLSENTGGFAVLNANDPTKQIEQIYQENQHYYLLGYQPSNPRTEGRFRKVEVRANRPDVTVRTRNGYFEPRKAKANAPAAAATPAVTSALQGVLPMGDLPLQMTAASFAGRSGKRADVAIVVGVRESMPPGSAATTSDVEVAAHAYDTGWRLRASESFTVRLGVESDPGQPVQYALMSRLGLEPGRYQLRVAVQSSLAGRRGSAYYDLTVPDFTKPELSSSGVVLDVRPPAVSAPVAALSHLLSFDPSARREFGSGEEVTVFLRIYQRGRTPALPVRITARVLDRSGSSVWSSAEDIGRERFAATGEADYRVELPVSTLEPGQYLLEIAAADGRSTVRRELRFERQ
jgi:VWFA-related protein